MGTLAGVKYEKTSYEKNNYVAVGLALIHPSDLVIASSYQGQKVISVGKHAFSGKKLFFNSVQIEPGITTIDEYAFFDCGKLKNVTLPNSLTTIGNCAFWKCTDMSPKLTLPSGVTSIGNSAFEYNHFEEVFIPKAVTTIGENAFSPSFGYHPVIYCEAETKPKGWHTNWCGSAQVRWGAKHIGDKNASTTQIEKTIKEKIEGGLPHSKGLDLIPHRNGKGFIVAGMGTCKDKIVNIPDMYLGKPVAYIAKHAFRNNHTIRGVMIPNTIRHFGDKAFMGCDALEAVSLADGCKSVGHGAFCDCTALTSITIPESVTQIGVWAFKGCQKLGYLFVPFSVGFVGSSAFEGCQSLTMDIDALSMPTGWDADWNPDNRSVNWVGKRAKRML